MKRPITLSILLLAGPTLATAQDQFMATSGSMVVEYLDIASPFTVAGPGFSASGSVEFPDIPGFEDPRSPGSNPFTIYADTENPNLDISLSVHGAPWALPPPGMDDVPGEAIEQFTVNNLVLTGPGTYFTTFDYGGSFIGVPLNVLSAQPGANCLQLNCSFLTFSGGGTVTLDVVPYPNFPAGTLEISKATFTFESVPEPSTASLLLLGFAGLAVLGCRHRAPATLLTTQ
jgi:hypothetical protein